MQDVRGNLGRREIPEYFSLPSKSEFNHCEQLEAACCLKDRTNEYTCNSSNYDACLPSIKGKSY